MWSNKEADFFPEINKSFTFPGMGLLRFFFFFFSNYNYLSLNVNVHLQGVLLTKEMINSVVSTIIFLFQINLLKNLNSNMMPYKRPGRKAE